MDFGSLQDFRSLCYKDYIHSLQDTLQAEGFEVWTDDRMDYGDEWPMVIQDKLAACDAFILVATDSTFTLSRRERAGPGKACIEI